MSLDTLVLELGKTYPLAQLVKAAPVQRSHDVAYATYKRVEERKVVQWHEVVFDVNVNDYTVSRIFDCSKSPYQLVERMEYRYGIKSIPNAAEEMCHRNYGG